MKLLEIDSRLAEIPRAIAMVDEFRALHGLAQVDADALDVILDEILTNSIRHGLDEAPGHPISVTLDYRDGEIVLQVEDEGVAFDPTQVPAPAVGGKLGDRRVGGLGVAFVRSLTRSIEYSRASGRNRLVIVRRAAATAEPPRA